MGSLQLVPPGKPKIYYSYINQNSVVLVEQ